MATDLDALLAEHGSLEGAATALRGQVETTPPEERGALLEQLADVQGEGLGRWDVAAEALEEAAALAPADQALLGRLIEAYERADDFESALAVLLDAAEKTQDPSGRASLFVRAAAAAARLEQTDSQRLLLRRALDDDPAGVGVSDELGSAWSALNADAELAELLVQHAGSVAEVRGEAAAMPLIEAAARGYERARRLELAEALWFRAANAAGASAAPVEALVAVREQLEDWEGVAEALARLAAVCRDPASEAAAHRRAAAVLADRLQKPVDALEALIAAHTADGETADLDAIDRLARSTDDLRRQIWVVEARLGGEDEPDKRAQLLVARSELERRAGDETAALRSLRGALHYAPSDRHALAAMEAQLLSGSDWRELDAHLARWCDLAEGAERAAVAVRRAGVLERELREPSRAAEALEIARAAGGTGLDVLLPLLRIRNDAGGDPRVRAALTLDVARLHEASGDAAGGCASRLEAATLLSGAGDAAAALAALTEVATVANDPSVLPRVEALRAEVGDVAGAADAALAAAEAVTEPSSRAGHLRRAAGLLDPVDSVRALALWRRVGELDPAAPDWPTAVAAHLRSQGELSELARFVEGRAEVGGDLPARARTWCEAADLRRELGDEAAAAAAFDRAFELDPTCEPAAVDGAIRALDATDWVRAAALLAPLLDGGATAPALGGRLGVATSLGVAREHVGDAAGATAAYEAAVQARPGDPFASARLVTLYAAIERWDEAERAFSLATSHASELDDARRLELMYDGGRVALALGDAEAAATRWRRALEVDPLDEPTLRALADLGGGDDLGTLEAKQALLQITDEPLARFKLLVEIADAYVAVGFPDGALDALSLALEIEPSSKVVRHKQLAIHTSGGAWTDAATVLEELTARESDGDRRKRYRFTVGAIYRDELGDRARAASVFEQILDDDPEDPDALDALEALHRDAGDDAGLASAYRRMLERLVSRTGDASAPLQYAVAMRLAALFDGPLQRPTEARAAYELAATISPAAPEPRIAIASIYPPGGKTDSQSIADHLAVVSVAPMHEDSYHILLGALRRERRMDEAWLVASALSVLGNRERLPTQVYTEHRPASVALARRGLTKEEWRSLQHPSMSSEAARLLAAISMTLGRVAAQDLGALGVHRRNDWIDTSAPSPVTNLFHYAVQVVGVAMPALYRWPGGAGLRNANVLPHTVLVGADVLESASDRRLVFKVARMCCLLRPEYWLASAVDRATLTAMVQATISLFTGGPPAAWDSAPLRAWMAAIREEPDTLLEHLRGAVDVYLRAGQSLDLNAWIRGIELTAHRVGMLLCGDLPRAVQASDQLADSLGGLDSHERAVELIRFAVDPMHATLRGELGLGVGQA
ncbi:MAG: tetratricopeptide repeat protein [Myxococcales bacterium]|nr:tetratricopeptide repeat protein [Myxococcales bacterium]